MDTGNGQGFVTRLAASLVAATAPSPAVDEALSDTGERYGLDLVGAVLPRGAMTVNRQDGSTMLVPAPTAYRMDQTTAVLDLLGEARSGWLDPDVGIRRLDAIDAMPPTSGRLIRFVGVMLIVIGLCFNQDPGAHELLVTVLLSLVVAAMFVLMTSSGVFGLFNSMTVGFLTALPVAILWHAGFLDAPTQIMIPLMSMFTPGAALTVAILEMSGGATQVGATRLIGGVLQLFLLAFGIVAAVAIAPDPGAVLEGNNPPMPPGLRFAGVVLYVIGALLAFSAPRSALRWLAIVIAAGWGTQELVSQVLQGYAASFIAAAVGVLIAELIRRRFDGPPALVTLNPIFRILAPGGLALLGVTSATSQGMINGSAAQNFGSLAFTFIAVALGMVSGHLLARRWGSWSTTMHWGLGE